MSYSFFYIDENYRDEWESMVQGNISTTFMQSFVWADYRRSVGWKTYKIGMKDKAGKFIGGAIVMRNNYCDDYNYLYIPTGPVLPYAHPKANEMFDALIEEVSNLASKDEESVTSHLRIDPLITVFPAPIKSSLKKSRWFFEPEVTRVIDLKMSEEDIIGQMDTKGRYNIRLAERKGVRIYEDISDVGIGIFLDLYTKTQKRVGYDGKSREYFENLLPFLFDNKMATILIAEHEGTPLAAGLYILYGERAIYFYSGTSDEKRNLKANYLLNWQAMKFAKVRGCSIFDLWGIAFNEANKEDDWYGFSRFKKEFGGNRVDFVGANDLIFNKGFYKRYLKESREEGSS